MRATILGLNGAMNGAVELCAVAAGGLCCLSVALVALRRRRVAGALEFAWMCFGQAAWIAGFFAEMLASTRSGKLFWDDFQLLLIPPMIGASQLFIRAYISRPTPHPLRTGVVFAAPTLPLVVFVLSDPWHGLARGAAFVEAAPPFGHLTYAFGSFELATYMYALMASLYGAALLAGQAMTQPRDRGRSLLLAAAMVFPSAVGVYTLLGFTLTSQRDPAPFSFGVSSLFVGWGLFKQRLFDLAPVARDVVIEHLPDAVVVIDGDRRVVDVNPSGLALLGTFSEVEGRAVDEVLPVSELSERIDAVLSEDARTSTAELHLDLEVAGSPREFACMVVALRAGGRTGAAIVLRDVTEAEHARRLLEEARRDLEGRVVERTAELSAVNTALRAEISERQRSDEERRRLEDEVRHMQKMEALGRLAGGVAHDFNNLLTAILGYASLVKARAGDAPVAGFADEIIAAAQGASGLTRQLLAFARKGPPDVRVIDTAQALAGVVPLMRRLLREDIQLRTGVDATWRVRLANEQFQQIVVNLVVNAGDAMLSGGKLLVSVEDVTLTEEHCVGRPRAKPGQWSRLRVEDSGVGIPPALMERVFEPFFTTKEPGKGTGLGLATVFGIVTHAAGFVEVHSELGVGTRFDVHLPRAFEHASPDARAAFDSAELRGTEHVVLVEDQPAILSVLAASLAAWGYRVHTFHDARACLAWLDAAPVDVEFLVTDVVLAGESGIALAEHVAARRPRTQVLLMSGWVADPDQLLRVEGKIAGFLNKPFPPEELARRLRVLRDGAASPRDAP